jgi:hypothetical protein
MVSTRTGGGVDKPARIHRRRVVVNSELEMNPPNPPTGSKAFFVVLQLLQQMSNTMANMQTQPTITSNTHIHHYHPETNITNSWATNLPLFLAPQIYYKRWLAEVHRKDAQHFQCTSSEKVLYASGRLTGPAADWRDAYCAAHAATNTVFWIEFSTNFRNYHIHAGHMKIKKKEFLSLKQGSMSVSEYRDKFIQLSRYAPREVPDDEKKQELFLEGLIRPLQYQLMSHSFSSFHKLLDKAMALEHKRVKLVEMIRMATN